MISPIPSWFWLFLGEHRKHHKHHSTNSANRTDYNNSNFPTLVRTICVTRGLRSIVTPGSQYYEFGVPREGSDDPLAREGPVSPFMYVRGIREIGYGVSMEIVGRLHDPRGVTWMLAVGAAMSVGDAVVVAVFGRGKYSMVLYHLLVALYFGAMAYLRSQSSSVC